MTLRLVLLWAEHRPRLKWLGSIPFLAVLLVWAVDRKPPFALAGPVTVWSGPPGGEMRLDAPVRRDLDRECDVKFTRYIIDGNRFRHDFVDKPSEMSADAIRKMDDEMDRRLKAVIPIPLSAAPALPATYTVDLSYRCNPLHIFFPIRVVMTVKFMVLP